MDLNNILSLPNDPNCAADMSGTLEFLEPRMNKWSLHPRRLELDFFRSAVVVI